jgi:hypothetical protein
MEEESPGRPHRRLMPVMEMNLSFPAKVVVEFLANAKVNPGKMHGFVWRWYDKPPRGRAC